VRAAGLAATLAVAAGCASTWCARTTAAPVALQWPFAPAAAKVTFLASIDGFGPQGGSGNVLKALVYGKEPEDRHAFVLPVAVAKGADGRLAVADLGRRAVHLFLPATRSYLRLSGGGDGGLVSPVAVAFDDALRLYVSDSSGRVLAFGPDGTRVMTLSEAGGEPLQRPTGLAYSPATRLLYVVDTLANRVHAFDRDGTLAFSFGGSDGDEELFNHPTSIFRSDGGELYVTNTLAFRIEIFDERGGHVGSFGRHGNGSGDLAMPKGVAVDRDGTVYVVDSLFDNVQMFDRNGAFLLTLGRRGVAAGEFWLPSGAFVSADGELYVCDTYNRRIQVFRITERYDEPAS
jgi:DNA-binding beta-propeller fold protein YncE